MKKVRPIEHADHAGHIFYELKANTVPQCVCDLFNDLENIKKAFPTEWEQPGKKGKANPSDSTKQKMVSFNEPIPKKPCKDAKHCSLCKKHGGMHLTHNMSDCRKYGKDSKIQKGFRKGQCGSTALNKKTASTFAQHKWKV
jgi:hypothetical protein